MISANEGPAADGAQVDGLTPRSWIRRPPWVRAYPDKAGGWTLVTLSGDTMRIAGDAAVLAWEAFAGAGAAMGDVAAQLAARFERVPSAVLEEDLNRFAWELLCCGFVELVPEPPRSSPAR